MWLPSFFGGKKGNLFRKIWIGEIVWSLPPDEKHSERSTRGSEAMMMAWVPSPKMRKEAGNIQIEINKKIGIRLFVLFYLPASNFADFIFAVVCNLHPHTVFKSYSRKFSFFKARRKQE